ncbi:MULTISPECIES: GNAT family N-acetyltransferase [Bacillus]|uniref:GNAT family N-acetyltransferase n=1 Tax=Bacillus TaxID=1386 RepID=UPI00030C5536|nr:MULTISPECIES: N-acetyltransferase [Bacillus]
MIQIRHADLEDVKGIIKVCSDGQRVTYKDLIAANHLEKVIEDFYNEGRITNEIIHTNQEWNGWFVAIEGGNIVGAGGGGFTEKSVSELFVLYVDPDRKREGIGSQLLEAITKDQMERGANEQWVSVTKDNFMGIKFYEKVGFNYCGERPAYELPEEAAYVSLRYKRELK